MEHGVGSQEDPSTVDKYFQVRDHIYLGNILPGFSLGGSSTKHVSVPPLPFSKPTHCILHQHLTYTNSIASKMALLGCPPETGALHFKGFHAPHYILNKLCMPLLRRLQES